MVSEASVIPSCSLPQCGGSGGGGGGESLSLIYLSSIFWGVYLSVYGKMTSLSMLSFSCHHHHHHHHHHHRHNHLLSHSSYSLNQSHVTFISAVSFPFLQCHLLFILPSVSPFVTLHIVLIIYIRYFSSSSSVCHPRSLRNKTNQSAT